MPDRSLPRWGRIRVPDTRAPGSPRRAAARPRWLPSPDRADAGLMRFVDAALEDLGGWE